MRRNLSVSRMWPKSKFFRCFWKRFIAFFSKTTYQKNKTATKSSARHSGMYFVLLCQSNHFLNSCIQDIELKIPKVTKRYQSPILKFVSWKANWKTFSHQAMRQMTTRRLFAVMFQKLGFFPLESPQDSDLWQKSSRSLAKKNGRTFSALNHKLFYTRVLFFLCSASG